MLSILLLAFAADLAPPQMPALPEPVALSPARPAMNADDRAFMLTLGGTKDCTCTDTKCFCDIDDPRVENCGCGRKKQPAGAGVKRDVPASYSKSSAPSGQQFYTVQCRPDSSGNMVCSRVSQPAKRVSAPVCTGPNCKASAPRRGILGRVLGR